MGGLFVGEGSGVGDGGEWGGWGSGLFGKGSRLVVASKVCFGGGGNGHRQFSSFGAEWCWCRSWLFVGSHSLVGTMIVSNKKNVQNVLSDKYVPYFLRRILRSSANSVPQKLTVVQLEVSGYPTDPAKNVNKRFYLKKGWCQFFEFVFKFQKLTIFS